MSAGRCSGGTPAASMSTGKASYRKPMRPTGETCHCVTAEAKTVTAGTFSGHRASDVDGSGCSGLSPKAASAAV